MVRVGMRRSTFLGVLAGAVLVLGLGLVALFSTGSTTGPPSTSATTSVFRASATPATATHIHGAGAGTVITVPEVRGESQAAAVSVLTSIGLDVQTSGACCATPGYVLNQAPVAGSKVDAGSIIDLVVGSNGT
jgi:hypothetical protein